MQSFSTMSRFLFFSCVFQVSHKIETAAAMGLEDFVLDSRLGEVSHKVRGEIGGHSWEFEYDYKSESIDDSLARILSSVEGEDGVNLAFFTHGDAVSAFAQQIAGVTVFECEPCGFVVLDRQKKQLLFSFAVQTL